MKKIETMIPEHVEPPNPWPRPIGGVTETDTEIDYAMMWMRVYAFAATLGRAGTAGEVAEYIDKVLDARKF